MERNDEHKAPLEEITLANDTGAGIVFQGRLYAENTFFNEESGALTQQKLYITNKGEQAYSVVTSTGQAKEKRAYLIKREGDLCKIHNGLFDVTVNAADLITAVKGLCGISSEMDCEELLKAGQETDIAVNE